MNGVDILQAAAASRKARLVIEGPLPSDGGILIPATEWKIKFGEQLEYHSHGTFEEAVNNAVTSLVVSGLRDELKRAAVESLNE